MHSKLLFLSMVFYFVVTLTAFRPTKPVKLEAKMPALQTVTRPVNPIKAETKTRISTEVFFVKGEYFVPTSAKIKIKKLFELAKGGGTIASAKIISWGDQLRSHLKKRRLTSSQLKLVEDRNDKLEAYLERLDLQMIVRKISMAELPEVMDQFLSTDDRKLKESLESSKVPNASKSIVMFVLNNTKKFNVK